ncbi:MAG: hypothetical protein Q9183_002164 [Haloplaca sp. 2 TL-2023]
MTDGSYSLNGQRLRDLLNQAQPVEQDERTSEISVADSLKRLHHFVVPTLPHLLALLLHPTAAFPPKDVSLFVIDSISTPFQQAFVQAERHVNVKNAGKKTDVVQWAAGRRWAVMGELITALGKLAATRNMAVPSPGCLGKLVLALEYCSTATGRNGRMRQCLKKG